MENLTALRELNLSGNDKLQFSQVQNVVMANPGLTHLGLGGISLPTLTWLPPMAQGAYNLVELDIVNP